MSEAKESTNWGQSLTVKKSEFDAERITKDTIIQVAYEAKDYSGDELPIELIFQSWSNTTSPNADEDGGVWAKITTDDYTDTTATFTYDAIVEAYGTEDLSQVQAICIGDTNLAPVTCKGMIVTNCSKPRATMGVSLDCSGAVSSSNASPSLVVSYETFDTTTLTNKSEIIVRYEITRNSTIDDEENEEKQTPINLILQSVKDSNSPYAKDDGSAWIVVEPESFDDNYATFTYENLTEAYGVADFSKIDYMKFASSNGNSLKVTEVSLTECLPAERGTHLKEEQPAEDESGEESEQAAENESSAESTAAAEAAGSTADSGTDDEKKGSNLVFVIIGIVAGVGIAVAVIFVILTKESSQEYDIDKRRMVSKKKPKNKAKW